MQRTRTFMESKPAHHPLVASLVGVAFILPVVVCIMAGTLSSTSSIALPISITLGATLLILFLLLRKPNNARSPTVRRYATGMHLTK